MEKERPAVLALSLLLGALALFLLCWQALSGLVTWPLYYYSRLVEFFAILLFAANARVLPMRFEEMGIVVPRRVLRRSLLTGGAAALFTAAVLALLAAARGTLRFSLALDGDISRVTYLFVAPMQEILGKSVMLYSFELIFGERGSRAADLATALAFGAFHVYYGVRMMVLAALLSLFTGWMFRRDRCVWGCAVAHFALGFLPACFGFS